VLPNQQGSFRVFRFAGIDVFLHWSWFIIAIYEINLRGRNYTSPVWNGLEYVTLFAIVLLHEFGHSLACRQVGGKAEQIILWPLGGVAYVSPPQRPGATLWSIAAGPLVNVALLPVISVLVILAESQGFSGNVQHYLRTIWFINTFLLVFNLLPIYPLDGGQILRSLLWYVMGRARSLMAAAVIGLAGVAGLIVLAVLLRSIWTGVLAVFILLNCWRGLQHARILARMARLPRRDGYACPACHESPLIGQYWRCARCLQPFDTFEHRATCPRCGEVFQETACTQCGSEHAFADW
jgi:Zn-dependent protease